MKTLYLLRHAEAEDFNVLGDFARELSKRGQKQASQIGEYIAENKISFDKVLCSSSRRTCETLNLLNLSLNNVEKSSIFYNASEDIILDVLQSTEKDIHSLLFIGHNPSISYAAYNFSEFLSIELSQSYLPATLCGYEFEISDWSDLRWRQGKMICFYQLKEI